MLWLKRFLKIHTRTYVYCHTHAHIYCQNQADVTHTVGGALEIKVNDTTSIVYAITNNLDIEKVKI